MTDPVASQIIMWGALSGGLAVGAVWLGISLYEFRSLRRTARRHNRPDLLPPWRRFPGWILDSTDIRQFGLLVGAAAVVVPAVALLGYTLAVGFAEVFLP